MNNLTTVLSVVILGLYFYQVVVKRGFLELYEKHDINSGFLE